MENEIETGVCSCVAVQPMHRDTAHVVPASPLWVPGVLHDPGGFIPWALGELSITRSCRFVSINSRRRIWHRSFGMQLAPDEGLTSLLFGPGHHCIEEMKVPMRISN